MVIGDLSEFGKNILGSSLLFLFSIYDVSFPPFVLFHSFVPLIRSDNRVNHDEADKRNGQMPADLPPLKLCPSGMEWGTGEGRP